MISRSNSSNPVIAAASLGDAAALQMALEKDFSKKTKNEALLAAAEHGHIAIIELLVEYGAKLTYQSEDDGATAIAWATQTGNLDLFKYLTQHSATLKVRCKDGSTLLMLAAEHGCMPLINGLLNQKFDPAEQDTQGNTALMRATAKGNIDATATLLANSPDSINQTNHAGKTALMIAAENNQSEAVTFLLAKNADSSIVDSTRNTALTLAIKNKNDVSLVALIEKEKNPDFTTLLGHAIKHSNAPACRLFLKHGALVNINPNNDGWTPLMRAASIGNEEVTRVLLCNGANPHFADAEGWTPLLIAASHGHAAVIQLLLEHGVNINTPMPNGDTALMLVIDCSTNKDLLQTDYFSAEESVDILLENGTDINLRNTDDETALTVAVDGENPTIVSMLLNHRGASRIAWADIAKAYELAKKKKHAPTIQAFEDHFKVGQALVDATKNKDIHEVQKRLDEGAAADTPNVTGWTALHQAATDGSLKIAALLISKQANIHSLTVTGYTPLMVVARNKGETFMMQYLINQGARIDACTRQGWTVLMLAARYCDENMIKFLISQGASVHGKSNDEGWYAVLLAAVNKNRASVSLLFKSGATIDDAPAATEKLKNLSGGVTKVNILFEGLADNIKENIHQLFSNALTSEQFSHLLTDTNTKTGYLVDQKEIRESIRDEIILCIRKTKKALGELNDADALLSLQSRMQTLEGQLVIIQKTEKDTWEKTAKKELLALITKINKKTGAAPAKPEETVINDESKALFGTLSNLQSGKTEKIIAENLLKTPDDETREALRLFLSRLNSRARDQIKQTLFQAIKALADEPKMEEETNPNLTINKIKKAFDEQQRPVLFEILRAHESGAVDRDTGTWKKLERLMQQGAFLRVGLPKVSLTSPFKRLVKGATTDQEMNPLLQKPTQ
ncbi:MAG TPA: ankyrin repeat domain-containing protein [Gammaproteobacteria bacterium]|nr:ankyrin repeat domain-containing protein [Gammaproteobacteria bacterium]